jgi:type II secretory pathway predicted ATPase ExeA
MLRLLAMASFNAQVLHDRAGTAGHARWSGTMVNKFDGFARWTSPLTPHANLYFDSASQRAALSYLGYGLSQGEGLIFISGDPGVGKSTLADRLLATTGRDRLTAIYAVRRGINKAPDLAFVGQEAPCPIERFLHEEARAGRRCLLVIEEAQNLSAGALEKLRLLSDMRLGAHPLVQILLVGRTEFRTRLRDTPELARLRERLIAWHHLDGIAPGEVVAYIEHRLARSAWTGSPTFQAKVFDLLGAASGGVPRRLNQLTASLLHLASLRRRSRIDLAMLEEVLADIEADTAPAPHLKAAGRSAQPTFNVGEPFTGVRRCAA